jgi:lipid-binding SYLF domain-containing protein
MRKTVLFLLAIALTTALGAPVNAQTSREVRKVQAAIDVMSEMMSIPEDAIPPSLLQDARGLAIIPNMLKAGFIVGGRYGSGVLVVRFDDKTWSNPVFVTVSGGSLGWQIGAQATDVILVFKSVRSLDTITSGKFTLGADASVAAGPVGRHAEASTDIELKAEILSYSRSRGLFAGLAIEGASLQIDYKATSAFYSMAGLLPMQIFRSRDLQAPGIAATLRDVLARYTN